MRSRRTARQRVRERAKEKCGVAEVRVIDVPKMQLVQGRDG